MARTKDMTASSPIRLILSFALPILAGNMLQQHYNLVDSLIVGSLLGVTALTAVSMSGWLDWTVLSIPMGLAQGFSIQAAQSFGAGDNSQLCRTAGQGVLLATVVTILLEALSQILLSPALSWMNTPEETFHLTESYLRIIYSGLPVVMAGYNAAARLQGIVEISGSSLGNAVGTFARQNIGAGKTAVKKQRN